MSEKFNLDEPRQPDEPLTSDDVPLSHSERRAIRIMLEDERRARWFWTAFRRWVGWIAAVGAGAYTIWANVREHIQVN